MALENDWCNSLMCPIDCDDTLVVVPDFGCEAPNDEKITEVFYSNTSLVSGNLAEWNSRLSNSATATIGTIRSIKMEGDLPRVDPAFKTSKRGSSIPQAVDRIITFTIEDDKDAIFNFFANFQCGMTKKFWFRSGGHIYGGNSGIYGTLISSYEINSESDLMAHNWQVQFRFKSKCFPARTVAVI